MGITLLKVLIANPAAPKRTAEAEFIVDSGAIYSVVSARTLRRIGIRGAHSGSGFGCLPAERERRASTCAPGAMPREPVATTLASEVS